MEEEMPEACACRPSDRLAGQHPIRCGLQRAGVALSRELFPSPESAHGREGGPNTPQKSAPDHALTLGRQATAKHAGRDPALRCEHLGGGADPNDPFGVKVEIKNMKDSLSEDPEGL